MRQSPVFRSTLALAATLLALSGGGAEAVSRTWGAGSSFSGNSWNRAQNWTGDAVPGSSDVAIFDGTQPAGCTIDATVNVAGMQINAGYGGTVTQSGTYTIDVGASGFNQGAGTFAGGSGNFTIASGAAFTLTNGAFTAPTNTLSVGYQINILGGTFSHNNGTVQLWNLPQGAASILNASGVTFYNLIFRGWGNSPNQYLTNTCTVLNLLSNINEPGQHWFAGVLAQGSASITLLGNFVKTNSTQTFSVPLVMTNAGSQTIGVYEGAMGSALTVSKPSGTVTVQGPAVVSGGDVTVSGGTLIESVTNINRGVVILTNACTYTVSACTSPVYSGDFLVYSNANFNYTATGILSLGGPADAHKLLITNGTFSMTAGTLILDDMLNYGTLNMGTADFVVQLGATPGFRAGGTTFNGFSYNCRGNRTMNLLDDLTVTGDLVSRCTVASYFGNWNPSGTRKIRVGGSFTQTNCVSTFGNANLTLEMTGSGKTITLAAGSFNANLSITNSANVSLTRDFTMGGPARIYPGATLSLAGANFSATSLIVDGTLGLQGGETLTPANPTLNAGSTVRYDGAASPVTVRVWSYRKLDLNAPARQLNWTDGSTYNVAEAFTGGGQPGQRALLRSTTPGNWWYLVLAGGAAQDVRSVDVQDSNAGGGQGISPQNSANSGHNVNWHFGAGTVIYLK